MPRARRDARRVLALLFLLAAATLAGLLVSWATKIGPVLVILVPEHGVHLGDAASFVIFYLAAFAISRRLGRPARRT